MASVRNVLWRSADRPAEIKADLYVTGKLGVTGAATFDSTMSVGGALGVTGALTASGGLAFTGTYADAAISMTKNVLIGSKNNRAVVAPSAASMPYQFIFVCTYGTGTITLTGSAAETLYAGGGTVSVTSASGYMGWSDGTNWQRISGI